VLSLVRREQLPAVLLTYVTHVAKVSLLHLLECPDSREGSQTICFDDSGVNELYCHALITTDGLISKKERTLYVLRCTNALRSP
jgi:hypothetical protein